MASRTAKAALRKEMKKKLAALSPDIVRAESVAVTQKLLNLPVYRGCKRISVYASMAGEIDTSETIRNVFQQGKQCFVPQCDGPVMTMLRVSSWEDYVQLPVNKWGIREPALGEAREDALQSLEGLDLIIVPGLAFNREGWRLGHGRGYYDAYIGRCAKWAEEHGRKPPTTVALSLRGQIVDGEIPLDEWDRKVDVLLYPA